MSEIRKPPSVVMGRPYGVYKPGQIVKCYMCPLCGRTDSNRKKIERCRATYIKEAATSFRPGDFVETYPSYHWFSGNPEWVINPGKENGALRDAAYRLIYVVTAVSTDYDSSVNSTCTGGRALWHIRSLAMEPYVPKSDEARRAHTNYLWNGTQYFGGWTGSRHYALTKIPDGLVPDSILQDAAKLVGHKDRRLLS